MAQRSGDVSGLEAGLSCSSGVVGVGEVSSEVLLEKVLYDMCRLICRRSSSGV